MDALDEDFAEGLLDQGGKPCISLYQPTHRHHPENQQDPIRFRNLVKDIEESLRRRYAADDVAALIEPFSDLADDAAFWNCTREGLAVLARPGFFRAYRLQRPVPELAVVADSLHVKPLMRILQSADGYQILALTRDEIRLYEGNRDALDEVELADDVPRTMTDALGDELTDPRLTVASGGSGSHGMYHGHGGRKDQIDLDAERFFRAVDRKILERHSQPSKLPLLLAALPENQSIFRQVSHNTSLLPAGIDANPGALSVDELRDRAWQIVGPSYLERLRSMVETFDEARAKDLATADAAQAAEAAVMGRVESLLVDADRRVPGRIDPATGDVQLDDLADPEVDDVLDDLAALVMRQGGEVVVVPPERMPTDTGLAATFRY